VTRVRRRVRKRPEPLHWVSIIRIYASLQYAKGVRLSNGRGKTSECTTIATIQSDQDWQDRSHDRWRGLGCTYARNATGRQRSARRPAAWHQHAATAASCYAKISTRRLLRNSIINSNSLFCSSSRAAVRHTIVGLPDDFWAHIGLFWALDFSIYVYINVYTYRFDGLGCEM